MNARRSELDRSATGQVAAGEVPHLPATPDAEQAHTSMIVGPKMLR